MYVPHQHILAKLLRPQVAYGSKEWRNTQRMLRNKARASGESSLTATGIEIPLTDARMGAEIDGGGGPGADGINSNSRAPSHRLAGVVSASEGEEAGEASGGQNRRRGGDISRLTVSVAGRISKLNLSFAKKK